MSIDYNLLSEIKHGEFQITIRCKECDDLCGLVKGGLTGKPRLYCFNCDEIRQEDEIRILIE